jgi:hypothetical protein
MHRPVDEKLARRDAPVYISQSDHGGNFNMQNDTSALSKTQRAIAAIGTRQDVADYISRRLGWNISRQAIDKWYQRGSLPFQMADRYAVLIAKRAKQKGHDVTADELLGEVIVPTHRLPDSATG